MASKDKENKEDSFIIKYKKIFYSLIDEIFPFLDNCNSNKKINSVINALFEKDLQDIKLNELYEGHDLTLVPLDIIKETYAKTLDRKRFIENKAKTNVIGVSICVAVMSLLANNIVKTYKDFNNSDVCKQFIVYALGMMVVCYLLYGGYLALELLMTRNRIYITRDDEQILPLEIQKKIYGRNNVLNEKTNLIRTNYIFTSYQAIRNGLVLLLIFFAVYLWPGNYNNISEETIKLENKIEKLENKINKYETDLMLMREHLQSLEKRFDEEIIQQKNNKDK